MHDLAIRNVDIVDGTGRERFKGTVYVTGDRIAGVEQDGAPTDAKEEIDGTGQILAPGFIDVHTHDDIALISKPEMTFKTSQGVTTVIVGLCGYSPAPFLPSASIPNEYDILLENHSQAFQRFDEYFDAVRTAKPSVNYLALVGHSTLRLSVMDNVDREATASEIKEMSHLLNESLDAGAIGLSSGLAYAMAIKSSTDELIDLCRSMSERRGFYVTHIRNEADGMLAGVDEALTIGKEAKVPVVLSHHKSLCAHNHGNTKHSLSMIDSARRDLDVALDVYPYTYSSTSLTRERAARGGEITIIRSDGLPQAVGKSLSEVAKELNCSELEAVDRLEPAGALYHLMAEEDVQRVLKHDLAMIGSDGLPFDARPHPRLWGTFPRVLSRYVRETPLLSLETAIYKMTGLPASVFGLKDRGRIADGCAADLVMFGANNIRDNATAQNPTAQSDGVNLVLVNGRKARVGTGEQLRSEDFSC